jgi:hypothetical protein
LWGIKGPCCAQRPTLKGQCHPYVLLPLRLLICRNWENVEFYVLLTVHLGIMFVSKQLG